MHQSGAHDFLPFHGPLAPLGGYYLAVGKIDGVHLPLCHDLSLGKLLRPVGYVRPPRTREIAKVERSLDVAVEPPVQEFISELLVLSADWDARAVGETDRAFLWDHDPDRVARSLVEGRTRTPVRRDPYLLVLEI